MADTFPHYLEFRHIYKTFDYPVLVDVSFYLDPGRTLAIIGRSGVGKSVSLGHIMGFLKPDQGQVIVAHQDITHFSESQLREFRRKGMPEEAIHLFVCQHGGAEDRDHVALRGLDDPIPYLVEEPQLPLAPNERHVGAARPPGRRQVDA